MLLWMRSSLRRLGHWMRASYVAWMRLTRHGCDVGLVGRSLANTYRCARIFHIIIRTIVHWVGAIVAVLIVMMKILLLIRILFWI